jgi:hypothetical protein
MTYLHWIWKWNLSVSQLKLLFGNVVGLAVKRASRNIMECLLAILNWSLSLKYLKKLLGYSTFTTNFDVNSKCILKFQTRFERYLCVTYYNHKGMVGFERKSSAIISYQTTSCFMLVLFCKTFWSLKANK